MNAELTIIKRHSEGTKHKQILKTLRSNIQPIDSVFKKAAPSAGDKQKIAEIKLAAFIAEHNLSHRVADHMCDLLSKTFTNSNIAKNLKLKRTKIQAIINNVIGKTEKEILCENLKATKFSVLIDESTDIAVVKTVCVVVRCYNQTSGKIVSHFWDLIQLFDSSAEDYTANAEYLFNIVIQSFQKHGISLTNIIGFASDGYNTMMGCTNSVSTRFRQCCAGITVIKCVCHSLHLCASDACKKLPQECEKLVRAIYNFFKVSSKRQSEFKDFQIFTETDVHKLLRPAQTRWLSLAAVVDRILEQWQALRLYFDNRWLNDSACAEIHTALNDPLMKAYYYFMAWMLPKFTKTNMYFQSESTVIIDLHSKITKLYKELLLIFMKASDEIAEIKLAAFIAEHNLSHRVADHMCDLLSKTFTNSNIAKNLKLKRTKIQAIINNVIGKTEKEILCENLKATKFSVLIDESTDIAVVKTVCVVVRCYNQTSGKIVSHFWDLIQLFDSSAEDYTANAEYLFNIVIQSFQKHGISLTNIIGFASDGYNTMMGCTNSVSTRFRQCCAGITVIKCVCHSLHLCASDACKKLPQECEKLVRAIYNFFKVSSKRQSEFKDFQIFTETDVHKLLRPAQTRWLSLAAVVDRILEQWQALRLYFDNRWLNDSACAEIHTALNDPLMKAYYYFMAWMLPKFTKTNMYFQSESTVIIDLHSKITKLYKELLLIFMKASDVESTRLDDIDPTKNDQYIEINENYIGLGAQQQLNLSIVSNAEKQEFKIYRRHFIVAACVGIRKRYKVMNTISRLKPEICITPTSSERFTTLSVLFDILPRISPKELSEQQMLDNEWRNFPIVISQRKCIPSTEKADEFWHETSLLKDQNGEKTFRFLPTFMLNALSLPHYNAACERLFSQVNDIKTKKRNRLITKTIKGNILAQQSIRRNGNCIDFIPSKDMINKMTSSIYEQEVELLEE